MADNIRWLLSILISTFFVWGLTSVNNPLPVFVQSIFSYGMIILLGWIIAEIIYSELGRLQSKFLSSESNTK